MSDLERFGLEWAGPQDFIAKPMPDGYWTPWHIAAERIAQLEALLEVRNEVLEKAFPRYKPEDWQVLEDARELLESLSTTEAGE